MRRKMTACARALVAAVLATALFSTGCGGGSTSDGSSSGGSSPAPSATPVAPSASQEPSEEDWVQLGAQFAVAGADALQRALSESSTQRFGARPLALTVRTGVSFQTSYFCCGFTSLQYITVSGRVDVSADATGLVTVTETFGQGTLGWAGPSGTHTIELATDALRLTSQLVTVNGVVQPRQQFRLTGPITYVLARGDRKTTNIDVVLGYGEFHLASQQPSATGQVGPVQVSNRLLPVAPVTRRCACPDGPQPGAVAAPGCSVMCPS